jgi:hypothetical protein
VGDAGEGAGEHHGVAVELGEVLDAARCTRERMWRRQSAVGGGQVVGRGGRRCSRCQWQG